MALGYRPRTEVYRFRPLVVSLAVLAAILLQVFLPLFPAFLSLFDLPLLVVIYFSISRRNPSSGLLLGLVVGVLQDLLSQNPVGLYGMAKTVVGFAASSLGARVDTDRPAPRLLLVFLFVHFHQFLYASVERLLPGSAADYMSLRVLEAALVNALVGVVVFHLLDRFRKST
ncbi:rod shape-determining protein MreD [Acidobacteriia bacterium AH_259_A11_L15]|nr:rod shape-determining protein MreD [Acidobacteriia bacterium AH_259_A11_L15]